MAYLPPRWEVANNMKKEKHRGLFGITLIAAIFVASVIASFNLFFIPNEVKASPCTRAKTVQFFVGATSTSGSAGGSSQNVTSTLRSFSIQLMESSVDV